jgi:hypothetical protein
LQEAFNFVCERFGVLERSWWFLLTEARAWQLH